MTIIVGADTPFGIHIEIVNSAVRSHMKPVSGSQVLHPWTFMLSEPCCKMSDYSISQS